jgi:hypothetical protein
MECVGRVIAPLLPYSTPVTVSTPRRLCRALLRVGHFRFRVVGGVSLLLGSAEGCGALEALSAPCRCNMLQHAAACCNMLHATCCARVQQTQRWSQRLRCAASRARRCACAARLSSHRPPPHCHASVACCYAPPCSTCTFSSSFIRIFALPEAGPSCRYTSGHIRLFDIADSALRVKQTSKQTRTGRGTWQCNVARVMPWPKAKGAPR